MHFTHTLHSLVSCRYGRISRLAMTLADGLGPEKTNATHEEEEEPANAGVDFTQVEEKKLVRKIDLFLLPTIWLMYLLSYVDRTKYAFILLNLTALKRCPGLIYLYSDCSIGNAKIAGLQKDLHLSSGQYSISLVVFFITYVIFEVPSK